MADKPLLVPPRYRAGEEKYVKRLEENLKRVRAGVTRVESEKTTHPLPPTPPDITPGNTHAQARLPQPVIDPLVEALGRSTLGRSELSIAISQAVGEVEKEKLGVEKEKLGVEKEKGKAGEGEGEGEDGEGAEAGGVGPAGGAQEERDCHPAAARQALSARRARWVGVDGLRSDADAADRRHRCVGL